MTFQTDSRCLSLILALAAGTALITSGAALADHKQGHSPPGDGGGDDDGGSTAAYTLTVLGGFPGGDFMQSSATSISEVNADGVAFVTGESRMPDGYYHAAVWEVTAAGEVLSLTEIPPLPGTLENQATDANSDGIVVGRTTHSAEQDEDGDYVFPGFVSVPGFPVAELPSASGERRSVAWAINEHGDIVGGSHLWHVDAATGEISEPIDLVELGFSAVDINEHGVMMGRIWNTAEGRGGPAAIAWFDETGSLQTTEIGVLPDHDWSRAQAINNFDEVAGYSFQNVPDTLGGYVHAFRWTFQDGLEELGTLGGENSRAGGINDMGEIVGTSDTNGGRVKQAAFLWVNGMMFDLNDLADTGSKAQLVGAAEINNSGQIASGGRFGGRHDQEFLAALLTPNAP